MFNAIIKHEIALQSIDYIITIEVIELETGFLLFGPDSRTGTVRYSVDLAGKDDYDNVNHTVQKIFYNCEFHWLINFAGISFRSGQIDVGDEIC